MTAKKSTPRTSLPPPEHDERALAGLVLYDPAAFAREPAAAALTVGVFADPASRKVVEAFETLKASGAPLEGKAVASASGLGAAELQTLVDGACMAAGVAYHAERVQGAAAKRGAIEALRAAEGVEGVRLALARIEAGLRTVGAGVQAVGLADLPEAMPEGDNPAALFRGGWLRKGGGAFLVSTSGTGKSVFTIQASMLWALGLPAFGVEPVRPLKVGIVQAEDDAEEMAHFRNEIMGGLVEQAGLDRAQVEAAARSGALLFDVVGAVGDAFIQRVGDILRAYPALDLLIVNPFQSYFGGDISRNSELSAFLRAGLDPLIKPGRAGVLFVHHTNKPPSAKDRQGWGADAFTAYLGAGGAEIVNWARAVLALMPCENMPGVFRLVAGKRGQRLNWTDATGARTTTRYIAHSAERIFWRDATPEEVDAAQGSQGGAGNRKGDARADAEALALQAQGRAWKLTDLRAYANETFGSGRGRRAFDYVKENARGFHLAIATARFKGASFIGTKQEVEEAARTWDTVKGGAE